ncbi:MAG: hypothetical protein KDJ52_32190 [Anaerolineae bacterium]|nr:hypothetical protein [Anaerolineae bacterium]
MTQKSQTVIFFGSGPVAAKSLDMLVKWQPVTAVVTKNRPKHHKDPAPVEELAKKLGLDVYFADTKSELDEIVDSGKLPKVKLGIVIDYGVIISEQTIKCFELGIVNSHFSLLPEWRGADPITFSLLSGQDKTGISIMLIDKGMDTGPLLGVSELSISPDETNQTLTEKLIQLSDITLQDLLPKYINGVLKTYKQEDKISTYSSMLSKKSGILDPKKTPSELVREVRSYIGWPNSRICYKDLWLTITKAVASDTKAPLGHLVIVGNQLHFGCNNGSIIIKQLKPAGKNIMSASSFINGYSSLIEK